jgi:membrane-associated phospholipid phosphatase
MMFVFSALADAALLLPAAIVLLGYLAIARQFAAARIWAVALVACGATTLAAKLLLHACGPSLTDYRVASPSGHVSLATVFYGCLAILVSQGRPRWQKALLAVAVALFLILVGISRVRTGAHSSIEVVLGFGIGCACVSLFWVLHRLSGRPGLSPLPLVVGFGLALVLLGGSHFSLEPYIGRVAARLSATLDVCMGT